MEHPDKIVRGIRFYYDVDSEAYCAQVNIDDIEDVYALGFIDGKVQQEPNNDWTNVVDRQSGAFTQDEIDDATAWR